MKTYRGKTMTVNMGARLLAIFWLFLVAGFARPLIANPYTWQGTVDSNWFEPGNWDPAAVPGPDADVIVDGTILLTNQTAELASFTMTGGTLTFEGWQSALQSEMVDLRDSSLTLPRITVGADVTVGSGAKLNIGIFAGNSNALVSVGNDMMLTDGGVLTVYSGPASEDLDDFGARVDVANKLYVGASSWIYPHSHPTDGGSVRFVVGTLTVASDGGFNAAARGYAGFEGPAAGSIDGSRSRGGAHGGRSGASSSRHRLGVNPTGSLTRPVRPGSGGSSAASYGGGLIYIEATNASISGTLNANGFNNHGGAGGGILIDCVNLSGQSPLFSANGGNSGDNSHRGGGGGGRIALHYDDISGLIDPRFRTLRGAGFGNARSSDCWWKESDHGTVWFSTPALLSETVDNERFVGVRFHADGFNSWTVSSLTVSNSFLHFGESDFTLNVTGNIEIGPNGTLGIGGPIGLANMNDGLPVIHCGGDFTIREDAEFHVYAGRTNGVDIGLGASIEIGGAFVIESGGWVFPVSRNYDGGVGGSPRFRARSMSVAEDAGFMARGRGYRTQSGEGAGSSGASWRGGGGGHGGKGGNHSASGSSGGSTNGLALAPVLPGSGGGEWWRGGSGGGVIWIEIERTMQLSGILNADGTHHRSNAGGGSGGGILISAEDVRATTNAVISARGGSGDSSHGGGGGGGRIAVWRRVPAHERAALMADEEVARLQERITGIGEPFSRFAGVTRVDGGSGQDNGEPGTVRFIDGTPTGTVIMLR